MFHLLSIHHCFFLHCMCITLDCDRHNSWCLSCNHHQLCHFTFCTSTAALQCVTDIIENHCVEFATVSILMCLLVVTIMKHTTPQTTSSHEKLDLTVEVPAAVHCCSRLQALTPLSMAAMVSVFTAASALSTVLCHHSFASGSVTLKHGSIVCAQHTPFHHRNITVSHCKP